jgi:hypothetical protein
LQVHAFQGPQNAKELLFRKGEALIFIFREFRQMIGIVGPLWRGAFEETLPVFVAKTHASEAK